MYGVEGRHWRRWKAWCGSNTVAAQALVSTKFSLVEPDRQVVLLLHMEIELLDPIESVFMAWHVRTGTPPFVIIGAVQLLQCLSALLQFLFVLRKTLVVSLARHFHHVFDYLSCNYKAFSSLETPLHGLN